MQSFTCPLCGKTSQGESCSFCISTSDIKYTLAPTTREEVWTRQTPKKETILVKSVNVAIIVLAILLFLLISLLFI